MDTIPNTKAIRHHGGEATKADGWTGEGTGGQDVVVDGCVGWVCVEARQGLALRPGQVPQRKQVSVKALTCTEEGRPVRTRDQRWLKVNNYAGGLVESTPDV